MQHKFVLYLVSGFSTIAGIILLFSIFMGRRAPSNVSELFHNPRFTGGVLCILLTLLCSISLI